MSVYHDTRQRRTQFSILHDSLLESGELPFQSIVFDERIAEIFAEEEIDFGKTEDAVYTPAMVLGSVWLHSAVRGVDEAHRQLFQSTPDIQSMWVIVRGESNLGRTNDVPRY